MRKISPLSSCIPNLITDSFDSLDPSQNARNANRVIPTGVNHLTLAQALAEARQMRERHRNGDSAAADDSTWFAAACEAFYGAPDKNGHRGKAGTALWAITGWGDERACQRYAAGDTKPPAYFFRRLLRSAQGWTWLCLAMEGADASWWGDITRAHRIYDAIKGL